MGYNIYITRAEFWSSSDEEEITSQEWLKIIEEDPDLIPVPENGEFFVIWRGTTRYPETWFDWRNGFIYTKWPDKATFRKMYRIAQKLDAHLHGEEDEIYDSEWIEKFDDSFYEKKEVAAQAIIPDNGILARIKRLLKK